MAATPGIQSTELPAQAPTPPTTQEQAPAPPAQPIRFGSDLEAALKERNAKRANEAPAVLELLGAEYRVRSDLDLAVTANAAYAEREGDPSLLIDALLALYEVEDAARLKSMLQDVSRDTPLDEEFLAQLLVATLEAVGRRPTDS